MSRMILATAFLGMASIALGQATPLKHKVEDLKSEYTKQLAESKGDRVAALAARTQMLDGLRKMAEEAETADPKDHRGLAEIYSLLYQPKQALEHISQAMNEGPADEQLYIRQIAILARLGDLAGAEQALTKAIAAFPDSALIRREALLLDGAKVRLLISEDKIDAAQQRLAAMRDRLAGYRERFPAEVAGGALDHVERNLDRLDKQVIDTRERLALIGQPAIAIVEADWVNGGPINPQDLQGKVVLLDFWAMWCGPCIATFPQLRHWNEEFNSQGLVIIGVTGYYQMAWDDAERKPVRTDGLPPEQERAALEGFLKHHQLSHAIAVTHSKDLAAHYCVAGIPQAVIIDRAGKVRLIRVGSGEKTAESLEKCLRECLAEEPSPAVPGDSKGQ